MATQPYQQRVRDRVLPLFENGRRHELEQFRLQQKTGNRVYRVPLDDAEGFVIVKLPPDWKVELHRLRKILATNLVYGERFPNTFGRKRAEAEAAHYREWRAAGLPVPELIETGLTDVRVIEGLPFASLTDYLKDPAVPLEDKLEAVGIGAAALSHQHKVAMERRQAGLVHGESSPRNIMFDPDTRRVFWFDLEHPGEYRHMSVEDVAVRSLRAYFNGTLDWLADDLPEVVHVAVERYEHKELLWRLTDSVERGLRSIPVRLARKAGKREHRSRLQERLVAELRAALQPQVNT